MGVITGYEKEIIWLDGIDMWLATICSNDRENNGVAKYISGKNNYNLAIDFINSYGVDGPILVYTNVVNCPNVDSWTVPYNEYYRKVR